VVDTAHTWNTKNIANKLVQMRELTAAGIPPVEGVNLIERLRNAGDPEVFSKFIAGGSSLVTAREIHFLWGTKVGLGSHCVRYVNRCRRRVENVIMRFE
jgi:hypothetical protein